MCPSNDGSAPVVEANPAGDAPDLTLRALHQRIRQQEILAELGVTALQGAGFDRLLAETARLTAEGLRTEFCKVLEHIPSENRLLVRAGVGWDEGIVGKASIGADLASPAGFALRTGKPVISNHLENEERFRTPEILAQHGIHRAMNVILQGDGRPFGVLEVDSRSEDEFVEQDLAFLQGAANILGMAVERERHGRNLEAALERHQVLLKEMSHRVKNLLALVQAVARTSLRNVGDAAALAQFESRLSSIARGQDMIVRARDGTADLEALIAQIRDAATTNDSKYAHIEPADKAKVIDEANKKEAWLRAQLAAQAALKLYQPPAVRAVQINAERAGLQALTNAILNKPKPQAPAPSATPPPPAPEAKPEASKPEANKPEANGGAANADGSMEVD